MAIAILTPPSVLFRSSSSSVTGTRAKPLLCSLSYSASSIPKMAIFHPVKGIAPLGLTLLPQWNGLKHLGSSISHFSVKTERKVKAKSKGVYASLFGVGAPEVLVIGVVALLVFGPKGLAEVARNLGKTLRAFQPTIRELQEVSREFKNTLEREISLDETDNQLRGPPTANTTSPLAEDSGADIESNGIPSDNVEGSEEDSSKITAKKLQGVLAQLQKEQAEEAERASSQSESQALDASSDTANADVDQILDAPREDVSTETIPTQNPESNDLQEFASAVSSSPSPANPETEA